jgi:diaminopimelate epimerase
MKKIDFTKMVASGNDFIVIPLSRNPVMPLKVLARKICDRKFGVGADGLLILEESKVTDVRMRIFNADGSEAQMCGNGARCVALWVSVKRKTCLPAGRAQNVKLNIQTKAGIIKAEVNGDRVRIKLTDPSGLKLNMPIRVNNRVLRVNFINTGVPHTVIFAEGSDKIAVLGLGRQIRYHKSFAPEGTNVDFVEVLNKNAIKVRTYERGVEDETLACGTGSVASALLFALKTEVKGRIRVHTKSTEILEVYFRKEKNKFRDVWLQGKAGIVFKGQFAY